METQASSLKCVKDKDNGAMYPCVSSAHACTHTHMCTHTYSDMHVYTKACTHTLTFTHIHMHTHTQIHTHMHTHACTYSHAYTFTHMHAHTLTCTHKHKFLMGWHTLTTHLKQWWWWCADAAEAAKILRVKGKTSTHSNKKRNFPIQFTGKGSRSLGKQSKASRKS